MRVISASNTRAITRTELLIIVVVICVILGFLLPSLARLKAKASRVKCVNNLKNIGVAYRIFATDHSDRFSFELPLRDGGTLELSNNIIGQFRTLSNELFLPMLTCPTRSIRQPIARDWSNLTRSNISYYIALTARPTQPDSILSGDAGFSIDGTFATNQLLNITSANRMTYPPKFHEGTDAANILLSDGSVSASGFARWQRISPFQTNSLLVP